MKERTIKIHPLDGKDVSIKNTRKGYQITIPKSVILIDYIEKILKSIGYNIKHL
jgi:hypothetical protein